MLQRTLLHCRLCRGKVALSSDARRGPESGIRHWKSIHGDMGSFASYMGSHAEHDNDLSMHAGMCLHGTTPTCSSQLLIQEPSTRVPMAVKAACHVTLSSLCIEWLVASSHTAAGNRCSLREGCTQACRNQSKKNGTSVQLEVTGLAAASATAARENCRAWESHQANESRLGHEVHHGRRCKDQEQAAAYVGNRPLRHILAEVAAAQHRNA